MFDGDEVAFGGEDHVSYRPRWLNPEDPRLIKQRPCKFYLSLADYCKREKPSWIYLHRQLAMGDLVMLLPILRAFQAKIHRCPILIGVGEWLIGQLQAFNKTVGADGKGIVMVPVPGLRDMGAPVHLDLDGCLEEDHQGGAASGRHRMDLYGDRLGVRLHFLRMEPP